VVAGQWSLGVRHYVHLAIAPSTRRSYQAGVHSYQSFCRANGLDDSEAGAADYICAEWFASLGKEGRLHARSIEGYRSAAGRWWADSELSDRANPFTSPPCIRVLKGIARERAPIERAARNAAPTALSLTHQLLAELEPYALVGPLAQPLARMLWAAANLGVYGLLRPNEMLGSPTHRDRALTPNQITFFAQPGSAVVQGLLPRGADFIAHPLPDRFLLDLGPTKADQLGTNPPLSIAARPAVQALWRWMHTRRDAGARGDTLLFRTADGPPLSCETLTTTVARWAQMLNGGPLPLVQGRTFRRGGASGLLASGAAIPDIMAAGR